MIRAVAIGVGMGAGAASGVLSGFLASLVVLAGKRARNARLMARGEPPFKDVHRIRLEIPYALAGAIAGGITGVFAAWPWSIMAGAALPATWMLVGLVLTRRQ